MYTITYFIISLFITSYNFTILLLRRLLILKQMQQQEWNTTKVLSPNKYVATLNNRHLPGTTIVPLGKIQYHRLHRGVKLSARILEVQVEMEVVVVVVDGVAAVVVVVDQVAAGRITCIKILKLNLSPS